MFFADVPSIALRYASRLVGVRTIRQRRPSQCSVSGQGEMVSALDRPLKPCVPYRPAFDITGADIYPVAYPVGCVNTISLQTGQIRTADEFTYPTGARAAQPWNGRRLLGGVPDMVLVQVLLDRL
jgi:hypothetical protein